MSNYIALIIDGDIENTLGGACSRDIWNITKKLLSDLPIDKKQIYTFFREPSSDRYAEKIKQFGITNINYSTIINIKNCFDYVITSAKLTPTTIIFHYSGHGYQIPDNDGDELDGCDEIFLGHTMTDDFIWNNLVSRLPKSSHIFALMDACHSGSGMDFPYIWKNNKWELAKRKNINAFCSGFSLSACNDSQCASQDVGETTGFSGSLTAGICDCGNFSEFIHDPFKLYNILVPRLGKLNQTVELYTTKPEK